MKNGTELLLIWTGMNVFVTFLTYPEFGLESLTASIKIWVVGIILAHAARRIIHLVATKEVKEK